MKFPDPDQDLLTELDRSQRRSEALSFIPVFCCAIVASLASYAVLRFAVGWSAESALDVAGLAFILSALLLYLYLNAKNRS
jgi:hypothetical protein